MEAKALARGKPDDPYAGALILRQKRGANARVRILTLALKLGSDVSRPRRRLLFIGGPIDAALSHRKNPLKLLAVLLGQLTKFTPLAVVGPARLMPISQRR